VRPTATAPRTAKAEEIPNAIRDAPEVELSTVAEGALLSKLAGAVYVEPVWTLEFDVSAES